MISLCMIVKNEEKFIAGCLESVKGVVDEMVLVDTGSTDNTKEIALKYGAKIYDFEWIDDFSAARNFSLNRCKGNWILYLDADERLDAGSKSQLLKLSKGSKNRAYNCIVKSIDEVKNRPSQMDYVRFFPNHPEVKFEGAAHEQIVPALLKTNHEIIRTGIEIIHLGYNVSEEEMSKKASRNLKLLLKDYQKSGHSYIAFQIGQSYSLMNQEDKAVEYFKISLEDSNLLKAYKSVALRYLAAYELQKTNIKDAAELIDKSIRADEYQPLSFLLLSKIMQAAKDYSGAGKACRRALELNKLMASGAKPADMVIMVDLNTILLDGLNISAMGGDKESFNFFFKEYKKTSNNVNKEIEFYEAVINNKLIPLEDLDAYLSNIKEHNQAELVIKLLSGYKHDSLTIIEKINEKVSTASAADILVAFYESKGMADKAEKTLSDLVDKQDGNPSAYLFMISFYLRNSRPEDALEIVARAEKKFSAVPEVTAHFQSIKEKIKIFLSSQV